jgi:hypothetical protein
MMHTESRRGCPTTQLDPVFALPLACEYASLTRDNRPVTWPVTPYVGANGTLDISTGLSYPDKAERARRNPRVALSFSDPTGTSLAEPPTVLVQGRATVRDVDLQSNTDRYVEQSLARTDGMNGMPWFLVSRLGWYFARIWVEVTPERVLWWPRGDLSAAPNEWRAPGPVLTPPSDPAPHGARLPGRCTPPSDWRPFAERAERLGNPVVTMVLDGAPLPVRTRRRGGPRPRVSDLPPTRRGVEVAGERGPRRSGGRLRCSPRRARRASVERLEPPRVSAEAHPVVHGSGEGATASGRA